MNRQGVKVSCTVVVDTDDGQVSKVFEASCPPGQGSPIGLWVELQTDVMVWVTDSGIHGR